jgi:hypothetical protein
MCSQVIYYHNNMFRIQMTKIEPSIRFFVGKFRLSTHLTFDLRFSFIFKAQIGECRFSGAVSGIMRMWKRSHSLIKLIYHCTDENSLPSWKYKDSSYNLVTLKSWLSKSDVLISSRSKVRPFNVSVDPPKFI